MTYDAAERTGSCGQANVYLCGVPKGKKELRVISPYEFYNE